MIKIAMSVEAPGGTLITRVVTVVAPADLSPSQIFIKAAEKMGKEIRDMIAVTEPDPDD